MQAMIDAYKHLLRLLSPFFLHNVTDLGHIKPFRKKKLISRRSGSGPQMFKYDALKKVKTHLKK
jgi:hypothetical protein